MCEQKPLYPYFSSDQSPKALIKMLFIPHSPERHRPAFRCEQNKRELINSAPVVSGEESLQGYRQSNLIQFYMQRQ